MKTLILRLVVAAGLPLIFVGCASIGPPLPPSLELPKPPSDLRALRKGNTVTLTWTIPLRTTDRQTVTFMGPTRICRGLGTLAECGTPVDQMPAPAASEKAAIALGHKQSATYTGALPAAVDDPLQTVTYAVEVLNGDGRGAGLSNRVVVPAVKTPGPPEIAVQAVKDGVQVTWQIGSGLVANPSISYKLRLLRKASGETKSSVVTEIPVDINTAHGKLVDQRIEWEKTYKYRATVVTVISTAGKPDTQIEGADSTDAEVFAHDVFPPDTPGGVQAVFSAEASNNSIDLIWAPVSDADLAGYNVYRHEAGTTAVLLTAKPLTAPSYRDSNVSSGKDYFYSVSAVDVRGNESGKSAEAEERVP